jgi:Zn-dependent protease
MTYDIGSVNPLVLIAVLLVSVGLHEAMHGFTAHWLGDSTAYEEGRLTLNPLKHLDLYTSILLPFVLILLQLPPFFAAKPVPFNPYRVKFEEFGVGLIGLAGPLTNLSLAVIISLLLRFYGGSLSGLLAEVAITAVVINVGLFVFNMIPFPPLDGSRLLYAFAPEPLQKVMYQIESAGFTAIVLFMFLLFPVLAPLIVSINTTLVNWLLF